MSSSMTPGEAFLASVALIPARAQAALNIQQAVQAACQDLTSAQAVGVMLTILNAGPSAWWDPPPFPLAFPRDHGLHLACGPEWYWIICNLDVEGSGGLERIGIVLSMQRQRVLAPSVQAQTPWSDDEAQMVFSFASVIHVGPDGARTFNRRPNFAWAPLVGAATMQADPFLFSCGPDSLSGPVDVLPLHVVMADLADGEGETPLLLDLTLSSDMPAGKAFFLQGLDGASPPPRAGTYYSWPQLSVTGAVSVGGKHYTVRGAGWMDHELMYTPIPPPEGPPITPPEVWTPAPGIFGWTLCDFNFDNGDAMIAVGFQSGPMRANLPAPYGFYLRRVGDAWEQDPVQGMIVMDQFTPMSGNAMLPVSWACDLTSGGQVPSEMTAATTPWVGDGSFLADNMAVQAETPVDVVLTRRLLGPGGPGAPVTIAGRGYCETVGYEPDGTFMARALAFLASAAR
jgi:predicted secreted hydrolase